MATDETIIVQPTIQNITVVANPQAISVTAPGPQGAAGAPGLLPVFSSQGYLTVAQGLSRFYFEDPGHITHVRASVGVPSVGSAVIVQVQLNGTPISTVSIPEGEYTSVENLLVPIVYNDYVTVSIIGVGSVSHGEDLVVTITVD